MENSIKKALGFGLTSGIITTLGSMIGIAASTNSARLVLIAVFTIALADSLSDAMGIHSIEESRKNVTGKRIWLTTIYTFMFKFVFSISFVIPIYIFSLTTAVIIGICWGALLLTIFSIYLAKQRQVSVFNTILEHLSVGAIVIICTYLLGIYLERAL